MKKFAMTTAILAALAMAVPAAAHAEWYANGGYTNYDVDGDDVGGVTARLGYQLTPMFGVEGEGTFGVDDNDGAELNSALGIYGTARAPIGSSFDVHARAGYNQIDMDRSNGPDVDDGGLSYGAGVGWQATPGLGLRADWTRTEAGDADADALSLAGVVKF